MKSRKRDVHIIKVGSESGGFVFDNKACDTVINNWEDWERPVFLFSQPFKVYKNLPNYGKALGFVKKLCKYDDFLSSEVYFYDAEWLRKDRSLYISPVFFISGNKIIEIHSIGLTSDEPFEGATKLIVRVCK